MRPDWLKVESTIVDPLSFAPVVRQFCVSSDILNSAIFAGFFPRKFMLLISFMGCVPSPSFTRYTVTIAYTSVYGSCACRLSLGNHLPYGFVNRCGTRAFRKEGYQSQQLVVACVCHKVNGCGQCLRWPSVPPKLANSPWKFANVLIRFPPFWP